MTTEGCKFEDMPAGWTAVRKIEFEAKVEKKFEEIGEINFEALSKGEFPCFKTKFVRRKLDKITLFRIDIFLKMKFGC